MVLKIDMAEAYNRVEWCFLKGILDYMGFPNKYSGMIMKCVQIITFSIMLNGVHGREFSPQRGLRQGDPLSPYMFILSTEALSALITRKAQDRAIHGIRICPRAPTITHLLFVDDSISLAEKIVKRHLSF